LRAHVEPAAVSVCSTDQAIVVGTCDHAAANPLSAGASYSGLASTLTSVRMAPAAIRCASAFSRGADAAASSVDIGTRPTAPPRLPIAAFSAAASACTAGGCDAPTTTTAFPLLAASSRSLAHSSMNRVASPDRSSPAGTSTPAAACATRANPGPAAAPMNFASDTANPATRPGLSRRRWSACPPVTLNPLSTTYRRDMSSCVDHTSRELANPRAFSTSPGSRDRKSRSSDSTTRVVALLRFSTSRIGAPVAILVPSTSPVFSTGE
jgi:hypothetical protein